MNELLLFIEIIIIFSIVLLTNKLYKKEGLIAYIGLASVLANLQVAKQITIFNLDATLGNVLFASTFLATDILTECYSKKDAIKGVNVGLFSVITYLICTQLTLLFVPNSIDFVNDSMKVIFELAPRVCLSSLTMYYIANRLDVILYNKLKEKNTKLWFRNNLCTILCNCTENFGFSFLAFYKVFDIKTILSIAITTCIIETLIALCDTPFLYLAKRECKKDEKQL